MANEMVVNPTRSKADQLLAKHANIMRKVYENKTAGDMTFTGLLVEFMWDLQANGLLKEDK